MHKPRLQAPSDYISDVFDSLDPWPQQYSCSFRFKWLELIVPWGSSVIYRPGTLLLLLLPSGRYEASSNWIFASRSIWAPEWPQTPKIGFLDIKYTRFLHFWALFYPKPIRNALFKPFSIILGYQNGNMEICQLEKKLFTIFDFTFANFIRNGWFFFDVISVTIATWL